MAFKQKLITASTLMMQAVGELIPLPKSVRMTLDGFEFMRTVTGYQSSAAVNAAKKLGLFQYLETQKSVKEIAEFLKMTEPAAKVLLDPLVVACIAKPRTEGGVETYGLTDFGRKIFLSKYWNTQSSTVDFMDGSWDKWKDLPEILQGNDGHPDLKVYNPESPLTLSSASMMTSMLYRPAQELSRQLDLSNVNDIVCGTVGASMAKAMMEQKPSIDLTVCCLPQLIEVLPEVLKQYDYQKEPLEMVKNTGDATTDGWGKVDIYDMIFLVRKFAFFTPDHGIDYLNRAMKNIRPGGYVIMWEPYADMYDNVPWLKANLQLVDGMLGMPAPLWTKEQVVNFVKNAGYDDVKVVDTAGGTCTFVVARVPEKMPSEEFATQWHFADMWEVIADTVPESEALVHDDTRRSWREYENRAARLAQVFTDQGLGPDTKVSIFSCNCPEYLEAQFGLFKTRCVPININYRYQESELTYLLDNSDSEALVFQARFADKIAAIRDQLPAVRFFLEIDDGSGKHLEGATRYEEAIATASPMPRIERFEDDIYMLYTGGTTGIPKGVMYRHGDFAPAILSSYAGRGMKAPANKEELVAAVKTLQETGAAPRGMPACPLMHGSGMWLGVFGVHHMGGTAVTFDNYSFEPATYLALIEKEKITDTVIVGDSFGKPIVKVLDAARMEGEPYDLSSLIFLVSSGAMCSIEVKRRLIEYGKFIVVDAIGSSEGNMGVSVMNRGMPASETAKFTPHPTTKVFTEDWQEVKPGSGEIGLIANGGFTPVGYYKDPEKSAETFRVINGHRYSIPGDYAMIEADGTMTLLGRGSVSINTGGEKVFPEEVEEAIKTHPFVYDCLVVGVSDEHFGERVTAVISFQGDGSLEREDLINFLRGKLAGYKLPKTIVAVPVVMRAANGKANYKWAKGIARDNAG